jgi:hypothetical protein
MDDSTKFGEIVGDEDAQTPFELFRDKSMRDELSELLEALELSSSDSGWTAANRKLSKKLERTSE